MRKRQAMETISYHLSHTRRTFLLKSRRCLEISLAAILTPLFSFADETQQAGVQVLPLSARQEVLAKQLEGKLIAPCCFSQTVADHYSGAAAHMKQQIRQFLVQGQTEEQILNAYVQVYGERILAAPRASGFNLVAYLAPPIVLFVGIVGMFLWLTQWRRPDQKQPALQQQANLTTSGTTHLLRDRLRDELSRFDG